MNTVRVVVYSIDVRSASTAEHEQGSVSCKFSEFDANPVKLRIGSSSSGQARKLSRPKLNDAAPSLNQV